MKTLLFIILSLVICNLRVPFLFAQEKISAELSIQKDLYFEGEIMVVNLKFINKDTADYFIFYNCFIEDEIISWLEFKNESGNVYKMNWSSVADCGGTQIRIKPGKSYEIDSIRIKINNFHYFEHFKYLPAGKYILTSKYVAVSNSVEFVVIEK